MLFTLFLGTEVARQAWLDAVERHGRWLGLRPRVESQRLPDSTRMDAVWLETGPLDSAGRQRHGVWPPPATNHDPDTNEVRISASLPDGEVRIAIPPATPRQVYYARVRGGWIVADDLRLFPRVTDSALDPRGVAALLQFGIIPPPFTLFRNVRRIPGGHALRLRADWQEPKTELLFHAGAVSTPETAGDAGEPVTGALDSILERIPLDSALYFSGGVDSALLAARCARLGRTDVRLVNFRFGPEDAETEHARLIASHFGLRMAEIEHDARQVRGMLGRIGEDYTYPFGDFSVLPTNLLVHGSLQRLGTMPAVVEGTGADGAFGVGALYRKWRRVYAVPALARRPLGEAYRRREFWRVKNRLEWYGWVARRSVRMSLSQAFLAQNALDGIAFEVPAGTRADLDDAINGSVNAATRDAEPAEQLSLLDVLCVCAGRMASKSFDPLRMNGVEVVYPFLEPSMMAVASSLPWERKCAGGESKGLLKALLAREAPKAWVYRPKSGFTPPYRELMASDPLQELLNEVVLSPRNPLLEYVEVDVVREMVALARAGRPMGAGACDFLWALAFASAWLGQTLPADRATVHGLPAEALRQAA